MNASQRKYFINRLDQIKSTKISERYNKKVQKYNNDLYKAISEGKFKIVKPPPSGSPWSLNSIITVKDIKCPTYMSREVNADIINEVNRIKDMVMLGDESEALSALEEFNTKDFD